MRILILVLYVSVKTLSQSECYTFLVVRAMVFKGVVSTSVINPSTPHYSGLSSYCPLFEDFHVVKRAQLQLPRGSYSGGCSLQAQGPGQGGGWGFCPPIRPTNWVSGDGPPTTPPTGSLVAAINRLFKTRLSTTEGPWLT